MSARSRRKGHAWEREVAIALTDATGIPYRRNLEEVREGQGIDVMPAVRLPDNAVALYVQNKCGARPPIWTAMQELLSGVSQADRPYRVIPVVAAHRTSSSKRTEKVAVFQMSDAIELIATHPWFARRRGNGGAMGI